jgi:hypothetical protein
MISPRFAAALHDRLALAFIADLLITTGALTVYFAKRPPGRYRWPRFLAPSLLGTLAFGLAMYLWLNGDRIMTTSHNHDAANRRISTAVGEIQIMPGM